MGTQRTRSKGGDRRRSTLTSIRSKCWKRFFAFSRRKSASRGNRSRGIRAEVEAVRQVVADGSNNPLRLYWIPDLRSARLRPDLMMTLAAIQMGAMPTEYAVGWFTLALINAGLAQGKGRSGLAWWGVSLFLGPVATLLIVLLDPVSRQGAQG